MKLFKTSFLKSVFILLGTISLVFLLISNAAQPGIWNAGGGGYHLLYPEDSINFKKIQMNSEIINIQLYKGFAVVKGKYLMKNDTEDTILVKVGYPVNGIYVGNSFGKLNQVTFDGLYKLKAKQDGNDLPIIETPLTEDQPNTTTFDNDNWYVWENTFLPYSVTTLEVYFMVNTNNAFIREGYTKNHHNGFVYLLESGKVWKQPIVHGEFRLSLMDQLVLDDLHGMSNLNWKYDTEKMEEMAFFASKSDFSPSPQDNIVINYGKKIDPFDFKSIISKSDLYFNSIDQFSNLQMPDQNLKILEINDPYVTVSSSYWYAILFIGVIIIIGILFLFFWIIKFIAKRK